MGRLAAVQWHSSIKGGTDGCSQIQMVRIETHKTQPLGVPLENSTGFNGDLSIVGVAHMIRSVRR